MDVDIEQAELKRDAVSNKFLDRDAGRKASKILKVADKVWIQDDKTKLWNIPAVIDSIRNKGRSYHVIGDNGSCMLRNTRFVKVRNAPDASADDAAVQRPVVKSREIPATTAVVPAGTGTERRSARLRDPSYKAKVRFSLKTHTTRKTTAFTRETNRRHQHVPEKGYDTKQRECSCILAHHLLLSRANRAPIDDCNGSRGHLPVPHLPAVTVHGVLSPESPRGVHSPTLVRVQSAAT